MSASFHHFSGISILKLLYSARSYSTILTLADIFFPEILNGAQMEQSQASTTYSKSFNLAASYKENTRELIACDQKHQLYLQDAYGTINPKHDLMKDGHAGGVDEVEAIPDLGVQECTRTSQQ
jgi:hypothetical protein